MNVDDLRAAFRAAVDGPDAEVLRPDCVDNDHIWKAATGALDIEGVRTVVDHIAGCPRCAESWRVAVSMAARAPAATPAAGRRSGTWVFLAMAATLVAAIGYLFIPRTSRPADDTVRSAPGAAIESRISDAALQRDGFTLRWTPAAAGASYVVTLTDEGGRTLHQARDLPQPEYTVPPSALTNEPSGSRVFWRVEATLPDGTRVSSRDFATSIR